MYTYVILHNLLGKELEIGKRKKDNSKVDFRLFMKYSAFYRDGSSFTYKRYPSKHLNQPERVNE
jgi:hypothetical protein